MFLSFESSNARKISLEEGRNQDPGDPGVGKVRGGEKDFFSFKQGGGGTDLGCIANEIVNAAIDAERTFKCK